MGEIWRPNQGMSCWNSSSSSALYDTQKTDFTFRSTTTEKEKIVALRRRGAEDVSSTGATRATTKCNKTLFAFVYKVIERTSAYNKSFNSKSI